jgi:alkaline phosphatase D
MSTPQESASSNDSRRNFIRLVATGGAATLGSFALGGCFFGESEFQHGVASGDPLSDRVILWTRVTLSPEALANLAEADAQVRKNPALAAHVQALKNIVLRWEVALDAQFRRKVRAGVTTASPERDYTAKVDVDGLRPGTTYYYRFIGRDMVSPTGRTRTLPPLLAGATPAVKLAVFSCSNYPAGYFNVYGEAAKIDDLDAAIHLGDYIYEYSRTGYASERAAELGRLSEPETEIVTLDQYRRRHAQYRTDADLQALCAKVPLIAVWDDHESANDAWRDGAENHQPATEGVWQARRAAAIRAYYEWLPIREVQPGRPERIFRSFDFGTLLSLHMLDTRLIGRDQQLSFDIVHRGGGLRRRRVCVGPRQPEPAAYGRRADRLAAEPDGAIQRHLAGAGPAGVDGPDERACADPVPADQRQRLRGPGAEGADGAGDADRGRPGDPAGAVGALQPRCLGWLRGAARDGACHRAAAEQEPRGALR